METKKGALLPLLQVKCAQTVGEQICPYSVWCSTYPSVIRVLLNYKRIIPWCAGNFNSPQSQFISRFPPFPCEKWQNRKILLVHPNEKTGWPRSHPNIFSIPQPCSIVNGNMNIITNFCILTRGNMRNLYNVPYWFYGNLCYYIPTKRWYQWSLKSGF